MLRAPRRPRVPTASTLFAATLSTATPNALIASTTLATNAVDASTPLATTLAASGPTPIATAAAATAANIARPIAAAATVTGLSALFATLPAPSLLTH